MTRRYTYSRTIDTPEGKETFTAQEWDSFDEARTAVEKGVHDRRLQFGVKTVKATDTGNIAPAEAGFSGPAVRMPGDKVE